MAEHGERERERREFTRLLGKLHEAAGAPSTASLAARSEPLAHGGEYGGAALKPHTIDGWLKGTSRPRSLDSLHLLIAVYARLPAGAPAAALAAPRLEKLWGSSAAKPAQGDGKSPSPGDGKPDRWEALAAGSPVWQRLGPEWTAEPLRDRATDAVRQLAALRDRQRAALADDPWRDGTFDKFAPWVDEREPVSPSVPVVAAHRFGIPFREVVERLRRLGPAVPGNTEEPQDIAAEAALLSEKAEGKHPLLPREGIVSLYTVYERSDQLGQDPRTIAHRLSAYGYTCAEELPAPSPHDTILLARAESEYEYRRAIPRAFLRLVPLTRAFISEESRVLGIPPEEVANWLVAHHFAVEDGPLPDPRDDWSLRLLKDTSRRPLTRTGTIALAHLLHLSRESGRPLREIYDRCVELALPVPTAETVPEALDRVPRPYTVE
ncbi:wHTH domain-containing protein [Actinacidiphila acididurans]|uniref:wHTH-Hsp90 Na associated domain-containing protein n=1 Tax=Actinacidiphila acididurans TaxID=2784346 RepID=A0ABS2TY67_9ACTN|nr:hypothetical protein [Actinacidiphila acididurans]MBM9508284.1 hypothetical protein [Actinacidiphila acididurans]